MELLNKNFLITGASRGIGLAFAKSVQNIAGELHLVSRTIDDSILSEFAKENQHKVKTHSCDLSKEPETLNFANKLISNTHIDVLFNNAGLLTGDLLENLEIDKISSTISVNLNTPILLTRLFLPAMLKNKFGLIINNASVSGEFYFPCAQVYAATKGGLTLFTKSMQVELKDTGVNTLLLVTPGIETKMMDQLKDEYSKHMDLDFLSNTISPEDWVKQIRKSIDKDDRVCYPGGSTRMGLFINRHAPKVFEKIIQGKFQRNKNMSS